MLQRFKTLIKRLTPWMTQLTWMAAGTFGLGFLLGSRGDLAGAIFFTIFWIVGAAITEGFIKNWNK